MPPCAFFSSSSAFFWASYSFFARATRLIRSFFSFSAALRAVFARRAIAREAKGLTSSNASWLISSKSAFWPVPRSLTAAS